MMIFFFGTIPIFGLKVSPISEAVQPELPPDAISPERLRTR
jgi:hypothetical protein